MAKLYFRVQADYDKVIKLREEISKLKTELRGIDSTQSPSAFNALNTQLGATQKEFDGLVSKAAKAGAELEHGLKTKIYDASKAVNELSDKIIGQRAAVRKASDEAKRLGEAYREALKNSPSDADGLLERYRAAKKSLQGERDVLFGLTQEQAKARLSVKKLRDEYKLYQKDSMDVKAKNDDVTDSFGKMSFSMGKAIGIIGGTAALKELGSQIIRVRGEFQEMETSIETMVGKNVADKLIPQIKELAKISPLTMSDMVGAEKMMLGFNIQAEDTIKYLKAMSDLSMGSSVKFNSLTLAFSQMSAAGKLMGGDLNQMINAGFNPLQQIAKRTGKSIAQLKEEMSKGAVSAQMVQQAFIDATSAGGKFYKMSENASKTINGQLSMMEDAMDAAFNKMGQASEGLIIKSISGATELIENYETVGRVLVGLIATYGAYKTAVLTVMAVEKTHAVVRLASIKGISAMSAATGLLTKKLGILNAVMKMNPYAAVAAALTGLVAVVWNMEYSTSAAERAQQRFNNTLEEQKNKEKEHADYIKNLQSIIENEILSEGERLKAFEELKAAYPGIFNDYVTETDYLKDILKYKRLIAGEDSKRSEGAAKDLLQDQVKELERLIYLKNNGFTRVDTNGNFIADADIDVAIKAQQDVVNKAKANVSSFAETKFIEGIKNLKDKELVSILDDITNSLNALGDSGNDAIAIVTSLGGEFSRAQIEEIQSALKTEKESRKNKVTYKDDYEAAEKKWKEEKAKLEAIKKDKAKFKTKEYEEQLKEVEKAEAAFKKLGGDVQGKHSKEIEKKGKALEQGNHKLLQVRRKNQADEIALMKEGREKRLAQIKLDYQVREDEIKRLEEQEVKNNKEVGKKNVNANGLTSEQQAEIDKARKLNNEKRVKAEFEVLKAEKDAMNQYLIKYGQYEEKKKAIRDKYTKASTNAESEGEKLILQKQMEEALATLDYEKLKEEIDWQKVFGNLDEVSEGTLHDLKKKLIKFIQDSKGLSIEAKKDIIEAITGIDKETATRTPFKNLGDSLNDLKDTTIKLKDAQDAYNNAVSVEDKAKAISAINKAQDANRKAKSEATVALHEATSEARKYQETVGSFIGLIETFGIKPPEWMNDFLGGFDKVLGGLEKIDLMKPMTILSGAMDAVSGVFQSVFSIGGLINWSGSNAAEVKETIDRLTERNKYLEEAIDSLRETIEKEGGAKALEAYNKAVEYQKEYTKNLMEIAKAQAGYHDSHHSWGYYFNFSEDELKWIQENVKKEFKNDDSLWTLSPEEMKLLRENVDLWQRMTEAGKGGYGERVIDKLNDYIDQAGKIEELTENLKEGFNQIDFSSFKSSFTDVLMDMESSSEDFANNFEKMLQKSIFNSLIANKYSEKIRNLYDDWAKFGQSNNKLSKDEVNTLRKQYGELINSLLDERDRLNETFGWSSGGPYSQKASSKGFNTMNQETGNELNGRFTAMYESDLRREAIQSEQLAVLRTMAPGASTSITDLSGPISNILENGSRMYTLADDTRNILANSYLELQQIRENTGAIVKPIKQIQKDIAEVKRNTDKL